MDAYCASFILKGKAPDGKPVEFRGYSEHVWVGQVETFDGKKADMLHFAADSLDMPIGEICQVVADLEGIISFDRSWLDAYVPMSCVQSIAFEHSL